HNDFHVDNVLVQPGGMASLASPWAGKNMPTLCEGMPPSSPTSPELYLIDVPGVRFSGPLKWSASRASLIMLSAGWWERTSRSQRLRFWQTYLSERQDLELPEPRLALDEIERGAREYCRRVARSRDKRALRTNRDYVALRQPNGVAHGVADLGRAGLGRLVEEAGSLFERNLDRPVKLGHGKRIVEAELPVNGHAVHVAYARYSYRNGWKALAGRFRRGRALRGWCSGHALLERRIATPRPIAVCRVRRSGNGLQHYLATQWIEGSENLHLYGWRLAAQSPEDRLRRAVRTAVCLGELIGRMHASQIAHGDLKASNLLVVERDGQSQTYVLDTEDVRITRRLRPARRVRDLARLATSLHAHPWIARTILCRFLRAYVRQFPPGAVDWKPLWRQTARRSRRAVRRKRRRGRAVL
ncbi:MAG: lipopolysaccharide kinase InaA family protein, partial [Planctomycetota bacterium]